MSFSAELTRWIDKTKTDMTLVIRKIALDLFSRIILKTPVKTGRARMNWHVSIGQIRDELIGLNGEYSASGAYQKALADATSEIMSYSDADLAIFLLNNLPYIERLEDGSSSQAPSGMVKITLEEYPYIVEDAVKEVQ